MGRRQGKKLAASNHVNLKEMFTEGEIAAYKEQFTIKIFEAFKYALPSYHERSFEGVAGQVSDLTEFVVNSPVRLNGVLDKRKLLLRGIDLGGGRRDPNKVLKNIQRTFISDCIGDMKRSGTLTVSFTTQPMRLGGMCVWQYAPVPCEEYAYA